MASVSDNASREAGAAVTSPPRENLYRVNPDIALTRAEGTEMPTMTGHFAVWDQWTEIRSAYEGNFMERFAPQAMDKTLAENRPKVLFQHGKDPQIGDKVLGTPSRVQPDATGAYYEVPLYDTSYNRDLIPGLRAGEYGASFRFSVLQEDVVAKPKLSETNPRGIPERTVTEAKVVEFGPVTFPAYAGASAGIRSITDEVVFSRFIEDPERLEALLRSLGKLPEPTKTTFHFTTKDAQPVVAEREAEISVEPEPPEATTQEDTPGIEPEPSAATTPSTNRSLFWFAADPKLKGATK